MSVEHYENFPVASWLCPPVFRPAVAALYGYARTADDLADEGDAPAQTRLADLAAYRQDLHAIAQHQPPSLRWAPVFNALAPVLHRYHLPLHLLEDLLSAFAQDVHVHHYADRAQLLDYCRRSANPVGRLLLHIWGVEDPQALRESDAICTALQLINFWQDCSIDLPRGRLYIPKSDCLAAGVDPEALLAGQDSPAARRLIATEVAWARDLMMAGAPLVHRLPGRLGWELRLVVQGGLRILDRIRALDHGTLRTRPTIQAVDAPRLLWRALRMRPDNLSHRPS
ncbi:squalene synthase HpnC [Leptothrix ochracea]|uniref:squalene synthase HpnC n=1 Tax=Leptothrix ochracea TaxID=735331 RepID=UPI0034E28F10